MKSPPTPTDRAVADLNYQRTVGVARLNGRLIVAVLGAIGDWAAYEGTPMQTYTDIASRGGKISKDEAVSLFWWLNPDQWRR